VDTPRPSPRTNRTRRVPHPVLIGRRSGRAQGRRTSSSASSAPTLRRRSGPSLPRISEPPPLLSARPRDRFSSSVTLKTSVILPGGESPREDALSKMLRGSGTCPACSCAARVEWGGRCPTRQADQGGCGNKGASPAPPPPARAGRYHARLCARRRLAGCRRSARPHGVPGAARLRARHRGGPHPVACPGRLRYRRPAGGVLHSPGLRYIRLHYIT